MVGHYRVSVGRIGTLAVLATFLGAAAPTPGGCPLAIAPAETVAVDGWAIWSTRGPISRPLTGITFSDGDPVGRVYLAPSATTGGPAHRVERYDFSAPGLSAVWLSCQYAGSTLALTKATAFKGKQCRVGYAGERLASLSCG